MVRLKCVEIKQSSVSHRGAIEIDPLDGEFFFQRSLAYSDSEEML